MCELTLYEAAEYMEGKILQGDRNMRFRKFNVDTRKTVEGELFFAIRGKRDGHQFLRDGLEKGASGVVVSQKIFLNDFKDRGVIFVDDTLVSLQKLAKKIIEKFNPLVIAITGSIGKTTTKEFTHELISSRLRAKKSYANYNNHIGVPLSIMELDEKDEAIVLEMAMSSPGEIRKLIEIAPPDVSVITNVNPVHLEFFPSIEQIALAKKEILEGTKINGKAVLNGDDILVKKISNDFRGERIFFGEGEKNDICIENIRSWMPYSYSFSIRYGSRGEYPLNLNNFSYSMVLNLAAALGVSYILGIEFPSLKKKIERLRPFEMRGNIIELENGILLIDESYNSNPKALEMALNEFSKMKNKKKIAVLGDMLELGKDSEKYHREIGKLISNLHISMLITVGETSMLISEEAVKNGLTPNRTVHFLNSDEASNEIEKFLESDSFILIKGSRAIGMDKIVERLVKKFGKTESEEF
ncbi:MAG: UDP-N-acetylmuramoyl-tripeptide--D-alanyl-D-alanine ligase [Acidobacteriota bacterium]